MTLDEMVAFLVSTGKYTEQNARADLLELAEDSENYLVVTDGDGTSYLVMPGDGDSYIATDNF